MAKSYENLDAWKEAIALTTIIYNVTKKFPKAEVYGITSQMRRAAVSIASNIAEGSGRSSRKDFAHFITISLGSLHELESLVYVSKNLDYISDGDFQMMHAKIGFVGKLLGGFKNYLARS